MNQALVDQIANAVLYEGYMLYPYRPSVKNRQRWTFGGLYPRSYSEAQAGAEPWMTQTECLVSAGEGACLSVRVRFLQLQARWTERTAAEIPGEVWQEAVEREMDAGSHDLASLLVPSRMREFTFPGRREAGPDGTGLVVVREQQPIAGSVELVAECVGVAGISGSRRSMVELTPHPTLPHKGGGLESNSLPPCGGGLGWGATASDTDGPGRWATPECVAERLYKVTVRVRNVTPFNSENGASRDEALMRSLVSTHTILGIEGGEFVSLIDPPDPWKEIAAGCRNIGAWPVLVGDPGEKDTMLSAPIILYDYPRIAPESPGDLFDSTEIDEILTLRILTLTDDEKRAVSAIDDRARALLERTESIARDQLMNLHGTVRGLRPI